MLFVFCGLLPLGFGLSPFTKQGREAGRSAGVVFRGHRARPPASCRPREGDRTETEAQAENKAHEQQSEKPENGRRDRLLISGTFPLKRTRWPDSLPESTAQNDCWSVPLRQFFGVALIDRKRHSISMHTSGAMGRESGTSITVGDIVAYSAGFLRSTGQYTGDIPFARGKVRELVCVCQTVLARIDWNTQELPGSVNVVNLSLVRNGVVMDVD